ncbi:Hypothetical predicted protein [Octopus vulgaris]|uniref:Uncharacterized protein n=1 Tax=Octopus vulgaris TaxID=6645 RepID=A0AA36F104_OCTVU|nr:Hypothetical predicted protein [Octopus vulgaris]
MSGALVDAGGGGGISNVIALTCVASAVPVVGAGASGVGNDGFGNVITTAGYGEGAVVVITIIFAVFANGGGAARGVISRGCAGIFTRTTAAAVVAVIPGDGIRPVATAIIGAVRFASVDVVRSAPVDIREAIGKAGIDDDATVVVSDGVVRGACQCI